MRGRVLVIAGGVVAAVCVRAAWPGASVPAAIDPGAVSSPALPADAFVAQVVRVVDGDTLIARVAGSGASVRVRIIGVDTPETVKPDTPVRCFGPQASAFTKHLLPAGSWLRAAQESDAVDAYGRQLWDVWLPDGRYLESVLAAAGTARAYPFPPNTEHADVIAALQHQAQQLHRGLWGDPCDGHSF